MIGKQEISEKPATLSMALDVLENRKEQGGLGYEQQLAYDHAKKFAKVDEGEASKMLKELKEFGISEKTSIMIVDVMPIDIVQLKHILLNEKSAVDDETAVKIMALVEKHKGK